jgi:hypothetical protein
LPAGQFTGKAGKYKMKSRGRNLRWGDIDMTELELNKLILHFEQSNRAEGKSPKTISWYKEMLCGFMAMVAESPSVTNLSIYLSPHYKNSRSPGGLYRGAPMR